jgi:hypothetical protein
MGLRYSEEMATHVLEGVENNLASLRQVVVAASHSRWVLERPTAFLV